MNFEAGDIGKLTVSIRSTDIAWPDTIFPLIEKEFSTLQRRVANVGEYFLGKYFRKPENLYIFRKAWPISISLVALLIFLTMSLSAVVPLADSSVGRQAYLLSGESGELVSVDAKELVEELGVESAVSALAQGRILWENGYPREKMRLSEISADFLKSVLDAPPLFWLSPLIFFSIIYYAFRSMSIFMLSLEGRIKLSSGELPPREKPRLSDGMLPALIIGIFAGLMSSALFTVVTP